MRINITAKTFESKHSRKANKSAQPACEKAEAHTVGTYAPSSCVELSRKNIAFFESKKGQAQLARLNAKIEMQRDRAAARKAAIEALVLNERTREVLLNVDRASVSDEAWAAINRFIDKTVDGRVATAAGDHYEYTVFSGAIQVVADTTLKAALNDTTAVLHDGQQWSFGEVCEAVRKLHGLFNRVASKVNGIEHLAYEAICSRLSLKGEKAAGLKVARNLMRDLNRGTYRVRNGQGQVIDRI